MSIGPLTLTEPRDFEDLTKQINRIMTQVRRELNRPSTVNGTAPVSMLSGDTIPLSSVSPGTGGNPNPTTSPTGGTTAPIDATYVVMSAEPALNFERVLTAGTGITITDGGANSTVTIAATPTGQALFTLQTTAVTPVTISAGNVFFRGSSGVGANQIANLPAATGSGFMKIIKKEDANAFSIVVTANGGDLIDGLATYTVGTTQYASISIIDGAAGVWDLIDVKP